MAKFAPTYMKLYDGPDYTLGDLTLSAATFVDNDVEDTLIGAIQGIAGDGEGDESDSVITVDDGGNNYVKVIGTDLMVGSGGAAAGTFNITLTETNIYGDNNPKETVVEITVTAA